MARAAVRVGAAITVPVAGTAWLLRGPAGAASALGGVVLVIASFAGTGWSLHWAGRHGRSVLQAVALGGFGLRLGLYAIVLVLLEPVPAVDGPALAVATAAALVVLLVHETRLLSRRAELWWVRPAAGTRETTDHHREEAA